MAEYENRNRNRYSSESMPRQRRDWQEEQFQSSADARYGDSDYDRDQRGVYDSHGSSQSRSMNDGNYGARQRNGSQAGYSPLDDYDRASDDYRARQSRQQPSGMHGSFRGDSYGGEAMSGGYGSQGYDRGYGMTTGGTAYTGSFTGSDFTSSNNRGFFERAGDEVASWFGDEDAERRRREDHRGRGPSNYSRSNERLLETACETLTNDRGVDATNIQVTCDNNEVTLDGTVNTRWEKRRAEDAIHDISGVTHVQNNLRIAQADMRQGTTSKLES